MVPRINKILYVTDRSKNSSYAFLYAIDSAKKRDAKLVILHVIEPVPAYAMPMAGMSNEPKGKQISEMVESMKKQLEDFCRRADSQTDFSCADLVEKILVTVGHPPEEILNTADKEGCDMIVMGTHGKGFLTHTFLGRVALGVLQRTEKPVLTVPLPTKDFDWDDV